MDTHLGAELVEILRCKKGSIYKSNESKLVPQAGVRPYTSIYTVTVVSIYMKTPESKALHSEYYFWRGYTF